MYARHEYGLTDAGFKTSYDTLQSILGYLTIEACFVGTLSYNTFGVQSICTKSIPHKVEKVCISSLLQQWYWRVKFLGLYP